MKRIDRGYLRKIDKIFIDFKSELGWSVVEVKSLISCG